METLETLKNNYAQEHGYEDWENLQLDTLSEGEEMEGHMDEICIRAQKEALEKAVENAKLVPLQGIGFIDFSKQMLDKHSITNPENLIR